MTEDELKAAETHIEANTIIPSELSPEELWCKNSEYVPKDATLALTAALREAREEIGRLRTERNNHFRALMLEAIDIRKSAVAGIYPENTERRVFHHLNMLRQEIQELP